MIAVVYSAGPSLSAAVSDYPPPPDAPSVAVNAAYLGGFSDALCAIDSPVLSRAYAAGRTPTRVVTDRSAHHLAAGNWPSATVIATGITPEITILRRDLERHSGVSLSYSVQWAILDMMTLGATTIMVYGADMAGLEHCNDSMHGIDGGAAKGEQRWERERHYMRATARFARSSGVSLVRVMPRKWLREQYLAWKTHLPLTRRPNVATIRDIW